MSGAVTRKIEITRQLEEMRVLASEQQTSLRGRAKVLGHGLVEERLERQAAIIKTLEFCLANETDIRAWSAAKKGQSNDLGRVAGAGQTNLGGAPCAENDLSGAPAAG